MFKIITKSNEVGKENIKVIKDDKSIIACNTYNGYFILNGNKKEPHIIAKLPVSTARYILSNLSEVLVDCLYNDGSCPDILDRQLYDQLKYIINIYSPDIVYYNGERVKLDINTDIFTFKFYDSKILYIRIDAIQKLKNNEYVPDLSIVNIDSVEYIQFVDDDNIKYRIKLHTDTNYDDIIIYNALNMIRSCIGFINIVAIDGLIVKISIKTQLLPYTISINLFDLLDFLYLKTDHSKGKIHILNHYIEYTIHRVYDGPRVSKNSYNLCIKNSVGDIVFCIKMKHDSSDLLNEVKDLIKANLERDD